MCPVALIPVTDRIPLVNSINASVETTCSAFELLRLVIEDYVKYRFCGTIGHILCHHSNIRNISLFLDIRILRLKDIHRVSLK